MSPTSRNTQSQTAQPANECAPSLPVECILRINEFFTTQEKQPMLYLRLALVNKQFHSAFMSDSVWRHLDVCQVSINISQHYLQVKSTMAPTELEFIARFNLYRSWYPEITKEDRFDLFTSYTIGLVLAEPFRRRNIIEQRIDDRMALVFASNVKESFYYAAPHVTKDNRFMRRVVSTGGYRQYRYCSSKLRYDESFARDAVQKWSKNIKYAPMTLQHDRNLALAIVKLDGSLLRYLHSFQRDREVVLAAMAQYPEAYSSSKMEDDYEVRLMAVTLGLYNPYIPPEFRGDRKYVMAAVSNDGDALQYASEELRADRVVVMAAVSSYGWALRHVSRKLPFDRDIVMAAVSNTGRILDILSKELRADRDVVMAAVSRDGKALEYASEELRADRGVVMAAVSNNGSALEYASEKLRADRDVVMAAVSNDGSALVFASEKQRLDRDVVMAAVSSYGWAVRHVRELHADRNVIIAAVSRHGEALQYASEDLRADRGVVMAAVSNYGSALEYASEKLRADRDVVMVAISSGGYPLRHASEKLRADRDVVMAAISKKARDLMYAHERLQDDPEIIAAAALAEARPYWMSC